ncbi:hypothetical protein [Bacillus sp. Bos-x628]|uniref:hypothetical protein n=1 Tax=Bacillus maqinnsis TaxID=3229854 RepID=UPI00338E96C4
MRKLKNWLSVWFGLMMHVLVNPGLMVNKQGFAFFVADAKSSKVVNEVQQEKMAEEKMEMRRTYMLLGKGLMLLHEKTTKEARAGPVLPLQKR